MAAAGGAAAPAAPVPAVTYRAACAQARRALLGALGGSAPAQGVRLTVELPLPAPGRALTECVRPADDALFPGGMRQRFRDSLRPMVDEMLDGMPGAPRFVGCLEDAADGIGVWSCEDYTVVTYVGDQTFAPFRALMNGQYGERPTRANHAIILVNPYWSEAANVGQPWQFELREDARRLMAPSTDWRACYALRPVRAEGRGIRAQAGAQALLHRHSLEHDWVLCRTSGEWDLQVCADVPLAAWSAEPAAAEVRSALAEAARIAA
eukprot:PRCOL_00006062-RA